MEQNLQGFHINGALNRGGSEKYWSYAKDVVIL